MANQAADEGVAQLVDGVAQLEVDEPAVGRQLTDEGNKLIEEIDEAAAAKEHEKHEKEPGGQKKHEHEKQVKTPLGVGRPTAGKMKQKSPDKIYCAWIYENQTRCANGPAKDCGGLCLVHWKVDNGINRLEKMKGKVPAAATTDTTDDDVDVLTTLKPHTL